MRVLRGTPDGKRFIYCFAHLCHHATCLHCDGGKTLIIQALLNNDAAISFGLLEDLVDLFRWRVYAERDIRAEFFIKQWGVRLHSLLHIDNSRQWLIIDFDQIACIASSVAIICNHDGDRITVESYFAFGQRESNTHSFSNFSQRNGYCNITNRTFDIFSNVDSLNARIFFSGFSVYAVNACMSIRATQYSHMEHAGELDIIN